VLNCCPDAPARDNGPRLSIGQQNHALSAGSSTISLSARTRPYRLQPRRFSGVDPADEIDDLAEPVAEQEAGTDRRAVAGRAVQEDRAIAREVVESLHEPVQRDVEAGADALVAPRSRCGFDIGPGFVSHGSLNESAHDLCRVRSRAGC
jgi:hypothetical protein